jgi:hypothetical protein
MEDRQPTQAGTTTSRRIPGSKSSSGTETFTVLAEELEGTARAELWPKLVAASPSLGEFQAKTTRQIPLLVLTRDY